MKSVKKTSNQNSPSISGEWTSTFIDDKRIFNDSTIIEQQGQKIKSDISFNKDGELFIYKFVGQIKNNIINGIYTSTKPDKKENGTISLRIINEDLLFGNCTFINIDEHTDIVQTPYLLKRNNKNRIGTYKFCEDCVGKENCCYHVGTDIDMPVILPPEIEIITNKYKVQINDFATTINLGKKEKNKSLKTLYQIKKDPNTGICSFFKNKQCQIYKDRPVDCRIFPFDIKLKEDGKCYLVHYNSDKCHICDTKSDCIKNTSYDARIFLRIILPFLREWSVDRFSIKLTKNRPYTIICPIEDLF